MAVETREKPTEIDLYLLPDKETGSFPTSSEKVECFNRYNGSASNKIIIRLFKSIQETHESFCSLKFDIFETSSLGISQFNRKASVLRIEKRAFLHSAGYG
jgi:hypothetical protein